MLALLLFLVSLLLLLPLLSVHPSRLAQQARLHRVAMPVVVGFQSLFHSRSADGLVFRLVSVTALGWKIGTVKYSPLIERWCIGFSQRFAMLLSKRLQVHFYYFPTTQSLLVRLKRFSGERKTNQSLVDSQ